MDVPKEFSEKLWYERSKKRDFKTWKEDRRRINKAFAIVLIITVILFIIAYVGAVSGVLYYRQIKATKENQEVIFAITGKMCDDEEVTSVRHFGRIDGALIVKIECETKSFTIIKPKL